MAKAPQKESTEVQVQPLRRASVNLRIIGTTPLYMNRMSAKAKRTLLVGGARKTKADRAAIKHDPPREYRDSAEMMHAGPTALGLKVTAVKGSMATAALETPGLTKASVGRLVYMPGDLFAVYGTPQLKMDVVRSADAAKTPDVRTRAYLPRWCAAVTVGFTVPQLAVSSVVTLLCNAGVMVGVGDFRQEKGKGNYGLFRVIGEDEDDDEWDDLVANHGRAAQAAALDAPEYADEDTRELMEFFLSEVKRRAA